MYKKLHSFIHFSPRYSIFALLFTIVHSHTSTLLFTLLRNVTFQGAWATCDESELVHKFKFQSRTTCDRNNKYPALKGTMSTHLLQGFGFWSSLFTLEVLLLFSPLCLFRMPAGMVMGMNNVSHLIQKMLKNS